MDDLDLILCNRL